MPLQTYQIAQTLVAGNSDRLSIDEFGRLIRSYYACKFIFLGNLSLEQSLSLRVYKNTYSRLAHRSDPDSLKFYRKFLLIAGAREYQTYQNIDRVADERYREILDMMFKHRLYPTGETGTGTRIHVRQLDITFMHGFYGSSKDDSDHYLLNRVGDDTIEKAFKRLEVRNKRRVVCGHLEVPVAYVRTPNGTINKLTGKDLSSLTFDPQARYIIAPGALNHGHFALLRLGAKGRVSMDFKKLTTAMPV
ncbi:MAG: hypothetical protein DWQ09_08930 [Proteobacteria bacterium]|nr:MAG: hypothetical protein DWQ09_08930 [Pseudomonadota bacterium]QKK10719.1 MAG: hypothetical protein HND59_03060 [Pseudomonadota bacterium]